MHRFAAACGLVLVAAAPVAAQRAAWTRPFPAHRVIGNLYAVGTYDLGVFLITSEDGHILINTGLEDSTPLIRENIESLGFQFADVKILLSMQAHWDHTAALAEIREITGAQMWATAGDGPVLEDGGSDGAADGAAPEVRLHLTQTGLTQSACIDRGTVALTETSFTNLGRNPGTAYGYAGEQVGAVWCLDNQDLAVFVVAGSDWRIASDRVNELRDSFLAAP